MNKVPQQPNTSSFTCNFKINFARHFVSLHGINGWPPRSPHLTPRGFVLWGYLKTKVNEYPQSLEAFKEAIIQEFAVIPLEITRNVMRSHSEGLNQFINNGWRSHVRNVLFKTH